MICDLTIGSSHAPLAIGHRGRSDGTYQWKMSGR